VKIELPKDLRAFAYDRVVPIELNDFNVDILLPSVFFKVMSGGEERGRIANDPTRIQHYVQTLRAKVDGIDERTLDRLVRTTLIQTARQGSSRKVEQIQGFTGYTLITCKPGFPVHSSILRRVDSLIYRMMRDQFKGDAKLREFFERIFGSGLKMRGGSEIDGTYDGRTDLDTLTRLAIEFLDGFESVGRRPHKERQLREACPPVANRMARDLRRYMQAYSPYMPVEAFTYHLRALINFELFIYTLKLFSAICAVVADHRELPPLMSPDPERDPGTTPPFLYLDFTGAASGPNSEMAKATCRAVFDLAQEFIKANLTLRQLDRYIRGFRNTRTVKQRIEDVLALDSGPEYLLGLLRLRDDAVVAPLIEVEARSDEEDVRAANRPKKDDGSEDDGSTDEHIDALTEGGRTDLDRLVLLVYEGRGKGISAGVNRWLSDVGGLTKPYGLMGGSLRSRQSWRFMPSNDLLSTLVQLAAVNIPRWQKDEPIAEPIKLGAFLAFLEERFGILVDRPPDGFGGAEYAAAARENLRALLRRLKQMGIFRDLSDDFTVQQLVPPYLGEREEVSP